MRGGQWRDLSSRHGNFLNLRFLNLRPRVGTIASCRLATANLTALAASLPACYCSVAILLASRDLQSQNGGSSVPLKGLVINARSMKSHHKVGTSRVNNLDWIQDLVCSEHADIVLISETWLKGNILYQELFPLSDFILYRKDHKDRKGGGVLIAAKDNSFKSMREYVPDSENPEDLELVCAEMTTICNKKVLFSSIYEPDPDNDTGCWLEKFNTFLHHASETSENMVIGGDLNLSKISWDSLENTSCTKEVAFLEILNDHFLTQLNFIPTRHHRVLYPVITNVLDRVRVREVLIPKESDVFTDHGTVSFEFYASTEATHKIKRTM